MASISYRRDRKKWQVSYQTADEKQKRRSFRTKKEAEAFRDELAVIKHVGGLQAATQITHVRFADFLPTYFEWCEVNKADSTAKVERYIINAHLKPYYGRMRIDQIAVPAIERYKLRRKRDGVGNRIINLELTILSVIFKLAIQHGHARANPVDNVPKLKQARKPPRFLSEDEITRLLNAARKTYLHPLILCGLHAGLRKSELFNLKWKDIDFQRNTITVQPDADRRTKDNDFRVIEMTDALASELQKLYENRLNDEFVFTYAGKPLRSNVSRTWARILEEAQIENCSLHTLRHTFASHLAMQGVPLAHIQQLMGHDDYTTTLIYAHLSKESLRGQVQWLPFSTNKDS